MRFLSHLFCHDAPKSEVKISEVRRFILFQLLNLVF